MRYQILFLLRKNNFEREFESYHKILPLYLHNTLTAVAIVLVADYEVKLIIFVLFILSTVRDFKWKKNQKRQILENIILS